MLSNRPYILTMFILINFLQRARSNCPNFLQTHSYIEFFGCILQIGNTAPDKRNGLPSIVIVAVAFERVMLTAFSKSDANFQRASEKSRAATYTKFLNISFLNIAKSLK